jgi:SAM-dependent methyltransferase
MQQDVNEPANLYTSDEYIKKNPSLHEEDSMWKVEKIVPLVLIFSELIDKEQINLLDVGGGAGVILSEISSWIENNLGLHVVKYALDLSPGMLRISKHKNPSAKTLNEDIRNTTLSQKEIDLTLLIDVLEHIPNPAKALEEVKRISRYIILKVPLDGSLIGSIWNFIKRGEPRRQGIEKVGHINIYKYSSLKKQIEEYAGSILREYFTNVFEYRLSSPDYREKLSKKGRILAHMGLYTYKISPRLSAFLYNDFVMLLVKCD